MDDRCDRGWCVATTTPVRPTRQASTTSTHTACGRWKLRSVPINSLVVLDLVFLFLGFVVLVMFYLMRMGLVCVDLVLVAALLEYWDAGVGLRSLGLIM